MHAFFRRCMAIIMAALRCSQTIVFLVQNNIGVVLLKTCVCGRAVGFLLCKTGRARKTSLTGKELKLNQALEGAANYSD